MGSEEWEGLGRGGFDNIDYVDDCATIVVIMMLMVTKVAAAVMVVLLLNWGFSNSMPDDKSHMMQSVASNTDKMGWCILY